jgi:ribonuclease HII
MALDFEQQFYSENIKFIVGCDEAGRGCLMGSVYAGAVILPRDFKCDLINDSKQLTEKKRDKLFDEIMEHALVVEVEVISVNDVDKYNVYRASQMAMERCIERSKIKVDFVLTDCMPLTIDYPHEAIVKGDAKSASIAASSIIAKVTRDRLMDEYDKIYPMYGFKKHKGYCTKMHKDAIKEHGICEIHRKTFGPVKSIIEEVKYEQISLFEE